jgi:predicted nucleic acid-binding Zn finger protein
MICIRKGFVCLFVYTYFSITPPKEVLHYRKIFCVVGAESDYVDVEAYCAGQCL